METPNNKAGQQSRYWVRKSEMAKEDGLILPAQADTEKCARVVLAADYDAVVLALQRENTRLRDALEFYANPDTYFACSFLFDRPTGGFDEDFDEGHEDYDRPMPGRRARQALAGWKGEA